MNDSITADHLLRAKRMLEDNADEPDRPLWFYRGELRALGYERWEEVKPGDLITWQGQKIIVAGAPIPK